MVHMTTSTLPQTTADQVLAIRHDTAEDLRDLRRLAALDDRRLPAGPLLLGLVDGRLDAAVSIRTGDAIADPFRRTQDTVELLRHRAAMLRASATTDHRLARRPRRRTLALAG